MPFLFGGVDKGSFDSAAILRNDTVSFLSTPLSKGQNKTGIVTVLFQDGLAEKSRKVNLDANLTLSSIKSTLGNRTEFKGALPVSSNKSGTFANNTSIFTNKTTFGTVFGESLQPIAPNLIKSIPLNTLSRNLNNLTSGELAGVINTVPSAQREKLLEAAPPLSPPTTVTKNIILKNQNSSIVSFIVDIVKIVPDLIGGFNTQTHNVYLTWTPCIQFDSPQLRGSQTATFGSVFVYLIKINNCSNIFEKLSLDSQSSIKDLIPLFTINKFDLPPNSTKNLDLTIIIPPNTVPGFYFFDILAKVLSPSNNIAAESTGRIPLTVVSP